MKHAILIIAHNNLSYLIKIIEYFDDDFSFFIHLDKKRKFPKNELETLRSKRNVKCVKKKYKTNWGGFNILRAELFLMEIAVKTGLYEYYHLISGQDYPTKSLPEFKKVFKKFEGTEFIEYNSLPKMDWDNGTLERFDYFRLYDYFDYRKPNGRKINNWFIEFQKKRNLIRKSPSNFITLFGGSAWFSLTSDAIHYILNYTQNTPRLYNRLKYTFAPEETYIPTVLVNSPLKNNIGNSNLRYISWTFRNNSIPAFLDEVDFYKILETNTLFARKISDEISCNLISKLDNRIYNFEENIQEFQISSNNGIWTNNQFGKYHFDEELCEAFCLFFELMEVISVIDLGCGPGWYVNEFMKAGFDAVGIDGNPYTEILSSFTFQTDNKCSCYDLTNKKQLNVKYELALCLNVIEFIPADLEQVFLSNIVQYCNKYIIISWAEKLESNNLEYNYKNSNYVISKFRELGFVENIPVKNYFRHITKQSYIKSSLYVFQRI